MTPNEISIILRSFVFPALAAGALAWIGWYLLKGALASSKTGAERALEDFSQVQAPKKTDNDARMGSQEYKIRLAFSAYGLDVSGWEQIAVYLAYAIAGIGLSAAVVIAGLPLVLVLAAVFIGFVGVNALVDSKWDTQRLEIEREIPVMLTRLSSLLKANPNLIETLDNIAEGLDPQKPLKDWVRRFASKLQSSGRKGLEEMQEEASGISPSLMLAVVEIGRLWETGGSGYGEALRLAAGNMSDLMETRSQANAVAVGAWGTARTILLALGFTLGMVLINPVSKPFFSTTLMQIALLATLIWGGIGYWNIKDSINEVLE